jgi:hypothetical protein
MIVKTLSIELSRTHRQAICVAIHPGTVATDLSAPFQRGVPAHRIFSADTAARHILDVVSGLEVTQTGGIFAWDGSPITP